MVALLLSIRERLGETVRASPQKADLLAIVWGVSRAEWPFPDVEWPPVIDAVRWDNASRLGRTLDFECDFVDASGRIYNATYFGREKRWRVNGVAERRVGP
jgi:hypothetical protein